MNAQEAKQLSVENIPTYLKSYEEKTKSELEFVYGEIQKSASQGYFATLISNQYNNEVYDKLKEDGFEVAETGAANNPNLITYGTKDVSWGNFEKEYSNYKNK